MKLVMPLLVWPVSTASFFVLGYRCFRKGRFMESLPLLVTEFNSALIWGGLAANSIGEFNYKINGKILMQGGTGSMRNLVITGFI